MKVYAVTENCYVNGRFEGDENFNEYTEPVVLIKHGLFSDKVKAEAKATNLNEIHKGQETIEHFSNDEEEMAFDIAELELHEEIPIN